MRIYLKIENNIVEDVKFETYGCGSAIASSSMATELIKGKTVEEAWELSNKSCCRSFRWSSTSKNALFSISWGSYTQGYKRL